MKEVFETYLENVRYKDWNFVVDMDGERPFLQVTFMAPDATASAGLANPYVLQKSRKWMLSPYMTKSEVIQTAFKAVMTAEEHEIRETFTYRNKCIFGPHFNVDALVRICAAQEMDTRPAPQASQREAVA